MPVTESVPQRYVSPINPAKDGSALAQESDKAFEKAAANGWVVVKPKPNEVQIDIDRLEDLAVYTNNLSILKESAPDLVKKEETHVSPSGEPGHFHITLTLAQKITPVERIAIQAALGSDRKRELLSYLRTRRGDPVPTLFFEKGPEDEPF